MKIDTGLTVTVLGKAYPVQLDTGNETIRYREPVAFMADLGDGQEISDPTFRGLEEKD